MIVVTLAREDLWAKQKTIIGDQVGCEYIANLKSQDSVYCFRDSLSLKHAKSFLQSIELFLTSKT